MADNEPWLCYENDIGQLRIKKRHSCGIWNLQKVAIPIGNEILSSTTKNSIGQLGWEKVISNQHVSNHNNLKAKLMRIKLMMRYVINILTYFPRWSFIATLIIHNVKLASCNILNENQWYE